MEITKALLADYANIAVGGKLNVLGIFTTIFAFNFPAIHPQMQLIFMWEAHRSEAGRNKEVEVQLCGSDGEKILALAAGFKVPQGEAGKRINGNEIITLNHVKFEKSGAYVFNVLINGEHKAEAPFEVVPMPQKG